MFQFNLFGFRVTVQPTFWITTVLVGYSFATRQGGHVMLLAAWVGICFLSILWHELGHAFAFRRYKIDSEVVLYTMGGLAIPTGRARLTRSQDIVVSAAGPVFELLISVPVWWMMRQGMFDDFLVGRPFAEEIIGMFIWINLVWALVNLLPIYPLDGGHISFAMFGPRREKIALWVSFVFALGTAALCLYFGMGFSGVMFGMLAWNNWQRLRGGPEVPWMSGQ